MNKAKRLGSDYILGIETSCDETAAAVVADGRKILSNIISSQVDLHSKYGGVVPEIAARKHLELINPVVSEALSAAGIDWCDLSAIAVSIGPGLVGALLVGLAAAKSFAYARSLDLVGVNHLEGHIYANFLEFPDLKPPFITLIISGGHTILAFVKGAGEYEVLGQTLDDAAGEAFDKIAGFLGLGYPGGPIIDKLSKEGNPNAIKFPRAMILTKDYNFSLSGLKTAVLNYVSRLKSQGEEIKVEDICASFQEALIEVQVYKTIKAAIEKRSNKIVLAGGVASNSSLREKLKLKASGHNIELFYPSFLLCTDNAAMIASVGYYRWKRNEMLPLSADIDSNCSLGKMTQ